MSRKVLCRTLRVTQMSVQGQECLGQEQVDPVDQVQVQPTLLQVMLLLLHPPSHRPPRTSALSSRI